MKNPAGPYRTHMRTHVLLKTLHLLVVGLLAGCVTLNVGQGDSEPTQGESRPTTTSPALDAAESIGSTRNSRVAIPVADRAQQLVFLSGSLPDDERARLEAFAPNVRIISGLNRQTALEHAADAHAADVRLLSPEFLQRATNLVWVQAMSAGVDHLLANKALVANDRIVLTNMRAVHGPAIADHACAMLLTLTRNMRLHAENQAAGRWRDEDGPGSRATALVGKTMLVVGLGGIGSEIAQRAHGFGMRVIATRRTDSPAPEHVERVGKPDDLRSMLGEADVVAICVPLTKDTEHLFDAGMFAHLKRGSYLINIARGRIVDTNALVDALKSGRLAGACLDVTDPEPLPAEHPLWTLPNVVITPHVAADAEVTDERRWALFRENMRRFGAGEPLLNVVDVAAGY